MFRHAILLVLATLLLAACDDPVSLDDLLTIEVVGGDAEVPADGFSRVTISVEVTQKEIDDEKRAILFTTSAGTLLGGTAQNGGRKVALDAAGKATIQLQAGTEVGTARVRASVVDAEIVNEEVTVEFVTVSSDAILRFAPFPASAPADGATITLVTVTLNEDVPLDARAVTLTTTAGTFAASGTQTVTVNADAGGTVTTGLRSPLSVGTALIRATVNHVSREASIDFRAAQADDLVLDPGGFTLQASLDRSVTVRAQLRRDVGIATPGTRVAFTATDTLGQTFGFWRAETISNATGEATAVFTAGPTLYRGHVTLEARALPGLISDTASILIVDP